MNETTWLLMKNVHDLLAWVRGTWKPFRTLAGARKMRLFCTAVIRTVDCHVKDPRVRGALEALEDGADKPIQPNSIDLLRLNKVDEVLVQWHQQHARESFNLDELAQWAAASAVGVLADSVVPGLCDRYDVILANVARVDRYLAGKHTLGEPTPANPPLAAPALREVLGNPFWPPYFHIPRCPQVLSLARAIYHDRLFLDMPVLGDALEDAGCEDYTMLDHCRGIVRCPLHLHPHSGPPSYLLCRQCEEGVLPKAPCCRGCWVLDAVLGEHPL